MHVVYGIVNDNRPRRMYERSDVFLSSFNFLHFPHKRRNAFIALELYTFNRALSVRRKRRPPGMFVVMVELKRAHVTTAAKRSLTERKRTPSLNAFTTRY